jgi:hypothetical protein
MSFDSTADLLFRIGSNSDEAEDNLARFRAVFSKDFGSMREEFGDWAKEIVGDLSTVKGALIGGGAALATGLVAAAGAAVEATHRYAEYVEEIEQGSTRTQISTEHMTGLYLAAKETGSSFDMLTRGIAYFESQVDRANQGQEQSLQYFKELGITQSQLAAGEKDIIPLLDIVAKRYHELGSAAQRVSIARGLFSRSGTEDQKTLNLMAEGIEKLTQRAHTLGMTVTEEDVTALVKYQATLAAAKAAEEALDLTIGRTTLPLLTQLKVGLVGVWEAERDIAKQDNFFVWLAKNIQFTLTGTGDIAKRIHTAAQAIRDEVKAITDAESRAGGNTPKVGDAGTEKATEQFRGLSNMLETVKGEMAGTEGEAAKLDQKMAHMAYDLANAQAELQEKHKGGKLAPGVYDRELAAMQKLLELMPQLRDALGAEIGERNTKAQDSWAADLNRRLLAQTEQTRGIRQAGWAAEMVELRNHLRDEKDLTEEQKQSLNEMIDSLQKTGLAHMQEGWGKEDADYTDRLRKELAGEAKTLEAKHRYLDLEIDAERESAKKKEQLSDEAAALLEQKRKAGHAKIDADAKVAFDSEMARLREERKSIEREYASSADRIRAQYAADVAKYDAAAERDARKGATSPEQQAAVTAQFAAMRAALGTRMAGELQQLSDSTGWQGVFGAKSQEMIRSDEDLMRRWATGTSQGALLVKAALTGLEQTGSHAFRQLADGMGGGIAHAIVYGSSISKAMRQALAATLESIAAESMVRGIYSTALGFLDLALGDYEAAGNAFAAAAIFGSVGAAAAVAGRAVAGPQGAQGGSGGAGGGSGSGPGSGPGVGQFGSSAAARQKDIAAGDSPGATAAYGAGTHVTVNVQGHVIGTSGVTELCGMLSDAVMNKGATLTATNSKTGVQVTR